MLSGSVLYGPLCKMLTTLPSSIISNFTSLANVVFYINASEIAFETISFVAKSGILISSFQCHSERGTSNAGRSLFTHHKPSNFGTQSLVWYSCKSFLPQRQRNIMLLPFWKTLFLLVTFTQNCQVGYFTKI